MPKITSYGEVVVQQLHSDDREPRKIKLTFVDRNVYDDFRWKIDRTPGVAIVSENWGSKVYRTEQDAVEDVLFWFGMLPKAA